MRDSKRLLTAQLPEIEAALDAERERFVASIAGEDARGGVAGFLRRFGAYPDDSAVSAAGPR
jgi:hypothetical protein